MRWIDRIGRRLKLRDLHILMAVTECGSMTKAARQLAVSLPVVSKSIADLERTLGVRLLDRTTKGVEPTNYGRALIDGGVAIFDELNQRVKEIEYLVDPTVGQLRVGCPEWIAAGLLPEIVDQLSRQHPGIIIDLAGAIGHTLQFRELRDRTVDLVLGRIPPELSEPDLDAAILYREQLHVVAGMNSKWANRRKVGLAELVNEPWIMLPPNTFGNSLVVDAFQASGLNVPEARVHAFSMNLRINLLATGRYLSVVPGSFLRFSATRSLLKVLPIDLPIESRPVAIVTVKNRTLNPIAKLFIKFAREVARPLAIKFGSL